MKSFSRAIFAAAFLHSLHSAAQLEGDEEHSSTGPSAIASGTASTGGTGLWPGNQTAAGSTEVTPPYPVTSSSMDLIETSSKYSESSTEPTSEPSSSHGNSTAQAGTAPVPFPSSSSSTITVASSSWITSTRVAGNETTQQSGTGYISSSGAEQTTEEQPFPTPPSNTTAGNSAETGSSAGSASPFASVSELSVIASLSASTSSTPSSEPSRSQNSTHAIADGSTTASISGEGSSAATNNPTTSSASSSTASNSSDSSPSDGSSEDSTLPASDSATPSSSVATSGEPTSIEVTTTMSGSASPIVTTMPAVSGGAITSVAPISGSGSAYGTLDPSGTEATSRAEDIKTSLDDIVPILESYTKNPDPPGATSAIEAIQSVQPELEDLFTDLDPQNVESEDCGGSDPISALFNAVKCTANELEDTVTDIETEIDGDFVDMSLTEGITGTITGTLGNTLNGDNPSENNNGDDSNDEDGEDDEDDENDDQSSSQSASSSTASSTTSSCSASTITTSVCDTVCVTPTPASGSTFPVSASLTTQSCTTTCDDTTITACDATVSEQPESTTSILTISADACPLTSSAEGPWTTAWWDYGVSCAGSGCGGMASMAPGPSYSFLPWETGATRTPSGSLSQTGSSSVSPTSGSVDVTSFSTAATTSESIAESSSSRLSSTITSAPTESITPGCALIYSYSGNVGQEEYTKCLCDGTTRSLSTSIDGDTSILECPTTSGDFTAVSTKVNEPPSTSSEAPVETTSSASSMPLETFPPAPVDPVDRHCGAFGNYSESQGGGNIEPGKGVTLANAELLVNHFCSTGKTLSSDNNLISLAQADDSGAVFWIQAEMVSDECDVELMLGETEDKSKCTDPLMANINDCDTDTTDAKIGGRSAEGCLIWTALSVGNWNGDEPTYSPISTQPGDGGDNGDADR